MNDDPKSLRANYADELMRKAACEIARLDEMAALYRDKIERLTRERDHYKSEADNLRGLWNDPNHLALLEGRENAARGYAPKRTAPEHGECDDPEHVEAMRHLASIMDTEAERDRLRAALERIKRIGPLGVDTYPECYRRMHAIAVAALSGEPTSAVETSGRPKDGPGSILGCTCMMCEYHRSAEAIERQRRSEKASARCTYVGMYGVRCGLPADHEGAHRIFGPNQKVSGESK